jgi:hypothetical protein
MPTQAKFEVTCSSCNLRELCLPGMLCAEDLERVENIVYARRRVKRGEALFNAGAQFNAVYAIRSGFFKTSVLDGEGREQVTGFFMGGELVGLDGLGSGSYNCSAIALEDSEVCVLPYALIEEIAKCRRCSATCMRCSRARSCATTASCCCSARCAPRSASPRSCSTCPGASCAAAIRPATSTCA